jgi:hypothetical protein
LVLLWHVLSPDIIIACLAWVILFPQQRVSGKDHSSHQVSLPSQLSLLSWHVTSRVDKPCARCWLQVFDYRPAQGIQFTELSVSSGYTSVLTNWTLALTGHTVTRSTFDFWMSFVNGAWLHLLGLDALFPLVSCFEVGPLPPTKGCNLMQVTVVTAPELGREWDMANRFAHGSVRFSFSIGLIAVQGGASWNVATAKNLVVECRE